MDLGTLIGVGFILGFCLLIHALKIGVKRLAGYDIYVDLFLTFLLMVLFHGTQGGMVVALIGGGFISLVLRLMRWAAGYQKLGWYKVPYKLAPFLKVNLPRLVWYEYPPANKVPKGLRQQQVRTPIL